MIQEIRNKLVTAILEADRKTANSLLETWAAEHGTDRTVAEILEPSLETIGYMWENTGQVSLAQGYVAGKISEDFMAKVVERHGRSRITGSDKGIVVIGNIEDDYQPF
jgi:hypothetical protein